MPVYLSFSRQDRFFAARLNVGKLEFFAQDLREFFQRDFDFQQVTARLIAGLAAAVLRIARPSGVPTSPSPCPTPPIWR